VRIRVGDAPILHKRMMPLGSHTEELREGTQAKEPPAMPGSTPILTGLKATPTTQQTPTAPAAVPTVAATPTTQQTPSLPPPVGTVNLKALKPGLR
jgi:hypothetical protein